MPLLLIPLALLVFLALIVVTLPFSIISRYRAGTARRRARSWLALVNVFSMGISVLIFLTTAAISSVWIPGAFSYSAAGLAAGLVFGLVGLRLTRWVATPQTLEYTPNRWLVLAIMVGVTVRLGYGFWRAWHSWQASPEDHSWLAESGFAGSMATGAVVLGYYLAYWVGVWWCARSVLQPK